MDATGPQAIRTAPRDDARSASSAGGAEPSPSASPRTSLTDAATALLDAPLPLTGLALCDWPELHPGAASSDDEATVSPDALCEVKVVLGRAALGGGAPQRLPVGQIVVLDSAAQAPVEIWSGGQLVARGQLRTLDGHYCVQVNELLHPLARKRRP